MKVTDTLSFILILLTLIMQSCISQEEKVHCLNEILKERQNKELEIILADSMKIWANKELKHMTYYKEGMSEWEIDGLIENSGSDKLFGWILQVDNDDSENSLDYVHYFSGEKRKGKWFFYLHNMPSNWADREDNGNQKYTFEQLSIIAKKQVVKGGLIRDDCSINNEYIEGWVTDENTDMRMQHSRFLNSSSPD